MARRHDLSGCLYYRFAVQHVRGYGTPLLAFHQKHTTVASVSATQLVRADVVMAYSNKTSISAVTRRLAADVSSTPGDDAEGHMSVVQKSVPFAAYHVRAKLIHWTMGRSSRNKEYIVRLRKGAV